MNQLLKKAMTAVEALPPEEQEDIARLVLSLANKDMEAEDIDPSHLPSVLTGLSQADRGEFASDDEVAATFRRFG